MTHVTCRLTAKNRDQLGYRVWATFTFDFTTAKLVLDLAIPEDLVSGPGGLSMG